MRDADGFRVLNDVILCSKMPASSAVPALSAAVTRVGSIAGGNLVSLEGAEVPVHSTLGVLVRVGKG